MWRKQSINIFTEIKIKTNVKKALLTSVCGCLPIQNMGFDVSSRSLLTDQVDISCCIQQSCYSCRYANAMLSFSLSYHFFLHSSYNPMIAILMWLTLPHLLEKMERLVWKEQMLVYTVQKKKAFPYVRNSFHADFHFYHVVQQCPSMHSI